MSRSLKRALLALPLIALTPVAFADDGGYGLGRLALPEEVTAWDTDVRPDGQGLPIGSGSVEEGEEIFIDRCASCHGDFGEGVDRWPVLAGGDDSLASEDPVKTIGSYWPYASTVFDYVNRAMPFGEARSLSADETYAVVAYLLNLNYVIDDDFVLSNETFADVEMPNRDGFFMDDRDETEATMVREPCMKECKATVEITRRARVVDVTPDGGPITAEDLVQDLSVGDAVMN